MTQTELSFSDVQSASELTARERRKALTAWKGRRRQMRPRTE